jgi:LPXTG-motif cell wall-anchored protein
MGAIKSIFGGFSSAIEKLKGGKSAVKSANSNTVKTTSKITGSTSPIVTGGQSATRQGLSNFAKGVGSTANVGGKVFGAGVIVGGTTLAGAKIYDYVGDTWAVTTAQREYENQIKLAGQEADVIDKARQSQINYMEKLQDMRNNGTDSLALGASGGANGGTNSDLFPLGTAAAESAENNNTLLYAGIGIVALLAGLYIYKKK